MCGQTWVERASARDSYIFIQAGPSFGIADDSCTGEYEDTIGLNGRVGFRSAGPFGLELEVEGIPTSIANPSKSRKRKSENTVVFTLNGKIYFDVGHFEPYLLAGLGLVTFTEILFRAANASDPEVREQTDLVDFEIRLGGGLQFALFDPVYGFAEGSWAKGMGSFQKYSFVSWTVGLGLRFD